MDRDLYLARIGFVGQALPTLACLEELSRCHLESVPFENFDIHLGVPLHLDEASLFRKIVSRGRGGFCYELNGLFGWLLRDIGFKVELLSSRVVRKSSIGSDFDHLALRVTCAGRSYLVDVGFGDGSTLPLELRGGALRFDRGNYYKLTERGASSLFYEVLAVDGSVKSYELSLDTRSMHEFAVMCRHHQTSIDSWFTKSRICVLHTPEGTISLIDGVLKQGGDTRSTMQDAGAYLKTLRNDFGVDLPRMPANKSETIELRVRKQVCVWKQRARKMLAFAGQSSARA